MALSTRCYKGCMHKARVRLEFECPKVPSKKATIHMYVFPPNILFFVFFFLLLYFFYFSLLGKHFWLIVYLFSII